MATKRCHYCDKVLRDGNDTKDHIVPKSRGGVNAQWNIVLSCKKCNGDKGNRMPNCGCQQCFVAIMRWRNGERNRMVRYLPNETWGGPEAIEETKFCMQACRTYGCPYPTCKWPERITGSEDTLSP